MFAHITLLVFSRADGLYLDVEQGIDGGPMPVLIHSGQATIKVRNARQQRIKLYQDNKDTLIDLDPKFVEGLSEDNPLRPIQYLN